MENFQSRKRVRLWAVCDIVLSGLTVCFSGLGLVVVSELPGLLVSRYLFYTLTTVFGVLDILAATMFLWATKEGAEPLKALVPASFWRIILSLLMAELIVWGLLRLEITTLMIFSGELLLVVGQIGLRRCMYNKLTSFIGELRNFLQPGVVPPEQPSVLF